MENTTIYLVQETLNEQGAMATNTVCFSTIEKAREYIATCREYYIKYCKEHKYQFKQKLEWYDDGNYHCDDYTNELDDVYIEQTNKKRKPFVYSATIEKSLLH